VSSNMLSGAVQKRRAEKLVGKVVGEMLAPIVVSSLQQMGALGNTVSHRPMAIPKGQRGFVTLSGRATSARVCSSHGSARTEAIVAREGRPVETHITKRRRPKGATTIRRS
jgi:hypothetical protein